MSYGCYNRAPFRDHLRVQDGYDDDTLEPRRVVIGFRMAPDCQYTHTDLGLEDAGCVGCRWRAPEAPT